jgi:hypothetical protein
LKKLKYCIIELLLFGAHLKQTLQKIQWFLGPVRHFITAAVNVLMTDDSRVYEKARP